MCLAAALAALMISGAGHAADPPSPPAATGEIPVAPSFAPGSGPITLGNPVAAMNAMIDTLDKQSAQVMIEVDGRPVTQGEAADVLRGFPPGMAGLGFDALRSRALDQLVRQKLMAIAAEKEGLDKDPSVRRRQQDAAERALSEEWINRQAAAMVTEAVLRARYDRDVAGRPGPEEVRARIILVPTDAVARDLIAKAQSGADFGDLARKYSKDASAGAGGDLGFVRLEAVGPEIGAALFALAPGQVTSYPVRMPVGYFICRIEARRRHGTPTLEEARGDLVRALRREAALTIIGDLTAASRGKLIPPSPPAYQRP